MEIIAETLDDLLRDVFCQFSKLDDGYICSSRGKNKEIRGVLLKLNCPRARISHSEQRGYISSTIGEFFWYLSGSDDHEFITHYIPKYKKEAEDDGRIFGAYGPRLFGGNNFINQFENVLKILKDKPKTRQAVIQLFDRDDIKSPHKNIPCTCTLQFMIRNNELEMFVHMRSNDAYLGLSHDVFSFTMFQEIIATELNVEIGIYHHLVNSLHLYERNKEQVESYLDEGFQTTEPMPEMPTGACSMLKEMLFIEAKIRAGRPVTIKDLKIDDYWKDIARLLQIHAIKKQKKTISVCDKIKMISCLRDEMTNNIYDQYIRARLDQLRQKQ